MRIIDSIKKALGMYEAAKTGRRSSSINGYSTSVNAENKAALSILRSRSRDMVRNNPYAAKAVGIIVSNVIGRGIKAAVKGKSSRKVTPLLNQFIADCDYDDKMNLYGLQGLIMRTVVESGEAIIVRHKDQDGLCIRVYEGDYIDSTKQSDNADNGYIKDGIQFNSSGKVSGYWIFDHHPGDSSLFDFSNKSKFINEKDVIHVFDVMRAGQIRGVPWGVSGMTRLNGLNDYQDARVEQMKVAACFGGFITDDENSSNKGDILPEKLEPGMFPKLGYGQDIKFNSPPAVSGHDEFVSTELHAVASAYGVSYEALTGDFSKVNFSSGRMGWIEFQRNIERWQQLIIRSMKKVEKWFLDDIRVKHKIHKDTMFEWTPPRREMIDPAKEIPGIIKAVRGGLKPWQDAVRELGYDAETVAERIKEDNDLFDMLGLVLDSDARKVNNSGQFQAEVDNDIEIES